MKIKFHFKFLLALLLATAATQSNAAELRPVRIQLPSFGMTSMPTLIAHDIGLDHEAGLDFVFTMAPGSIGVKAMLAGDVDFTLSAGAAISASVSHAPVRTLAVHISKSFYYLYANKKYSTIKELTGKSIGIGAIGDSTDIAARKALIAANVDPAAANFVSMGIENVPAALIAGALDAGVITPPRDILMDRSGKLTNLGFLGDYLPTPSSGFSTTTKLIEKDPQLVQLFTNVVMRANKYMLSNREGTIKSLMKHLKLSEEDAGAAYDKYVPMFTKDGLIDEKTEQLVVDDQLKIIRSRGAIKPSDVFDLQFVKRAK